jgi:hypothetical protein
MTGAQKEFYGISYNNQLVGYITGSQFRKTL